MTIRRTLPATDAGQASKNQEPFTFVLEGVLPMSWNQLNRSIDKYARNEAIKSVHSAVERAWAAVAPKPPMFTSPVVIVCCAYFAGKRYDCDNLALKSLVDPLKGVLIQNDSPVYVHSVTLTSLRDTKRPRTELTFIPVAGAQPKPRTKGAK